MMGKHERLVAAKIPGSAYTRARHEHPQPGNIVKCPACFPTRYAFWWARHRREA